MSDVFFQPRLTGKRFDAHTLPVELLSDFAALEEFIIELAKQKYLDAHPDRKRVPRGFSDGISLNLATIADGSVITGFVLSSALIANGLFATSDPTLTYFEQAKESFLTALKQAEKDDVIELAPRFISYFNRIGKNLLEDESIEFQPNSTDFKAELNKQTRRRILLSNDQNTEFSENTILIVQITELDKVKQTFSIQNGSIKISGITIQPEHKDTIFKAFDEFELGSFVKMKSVAQFNRTNHITMINNIDHIDLLDADDIEVRFEHIVSLRNGWYYGDGKSFNKNQLSRLVELFNSFYPNELPNPMVYPTVDGKVQLEWVNDLHDLSLTVDLENMMSDFHAFSFENEKNENEQLDLNLETNWTKLISLINLYLI
ncbi:MAG: hypothetical protein KA734_01065 [Fluviicola sp.]|nr:hypothetical protein [Fluviicola sp.]MBP6074252.1 hypothetical protein [Flavobacterium sp.]